MKHVMPMVVAAALVVVLANVAGAAEISQLNPRALAAAAPQYVEISSMCLGDAAVPIYTVPAGKTLYLTDIAMVRGSMGETSDSDGVPMVILSRETQGQANPLSMVALLRAFVAMNQNVFFSLRTPIEIRGPDKLRARCAATKANKMVLINAFGYLK